MRLKRWMFGAALLCACLPAMARSLVLISVDGLRPDDLYASGKNAPLHLQALSKQGSHAQRVRGVMPTLTYPSHATILTGVSPAKHGIASNLSFDPTFVNQYGWYWYASDFKVPTLWDAAHAQGVKTANLHWPTSVGANIDANLPQIWRTGHADDRKLLATLATPGLIPQLEKAVGTQYPLGIDESVEADEMRAKFAAAMFALDKPGFMTVYFASLDHDEHHSGVDSPQALETLQRLDAAIGTLVDALRKDDPDVVIALVSDHGFAPVQHDVNLIGAMLKAGLMTMDAKGKVVDWKAAPWFATGVVPIQLRDENDAETRAKVAALLNRLASDPANGIERILDARQYAQTGAVPADFAVEFKPGYELGGNIAAPLLGDAGGNGFFGMHGYDPNHAEMDSVFFVAGAGVPKKDLGKIDMRDIAPTLARLIDAPLSQAEGRDLLK